MIAASPTLLERCWAALATIEDPEMPVNLVDLGLIYGLTVEGGRAAVRLTFTAMGCPATDFILQDVRAKLLEEPGVGAVDIEVVWDPPWSASRVTAEGRETLRAWGLSV
ncbi:MAG TPA: metal-sulfur cluster assembly factor [Candidatus Limnocylindrales bacterium]|nr:metal-sulfur cluster assembly factor [Candidatus Limnocylindrales bacterium]